MNCLWYFAIKILFPLCSQSPSTHHSRTRENCCHPPSSHHLRQSYRHPSHLQSAIYNLKSKIHRGHSSVGRAPALQAGSQGFESPCLQSLKGVEAKSNNRAHFWMH